MDGTQRAQAAEPAQTRGKNLLVNYISLLGGSVGAKAMSLLTVLMLTRALGVADFGRYSLVFSYWALLNTLVDLGVTQILGREIAKNPASARPGIEAAVYLRLLGCAVFLPLGFLLAGPLNLDLSLALAVGYGILVGFEAFYDAYFSATMQLDRNARARLLSSALGVILMGAGVLLKAPLGVIVLIGLSQPLLKFVFDFRYAPFQLRLHPPQAERIRQFARDGWPLWLLGIQYILLARIDTFMLQVLSPTGNYDLGLYSAAFRFSEIMALLINALCPAMLPLLVANMHAPERIRFLASSGLRLILVVLMAMSLFIFWYAPWIVRLYGPGYEAAAESMRILIWSQMLVAVNSLCYQLLVVYNVQGRWPLILSSLFATALNIGLNALWIPSLRAVGASWATVVTELAIVVMMLGFIARYTPLRLFRDVVLIELLAGLACLPILPLGDRFGLLSVLLFVGLVFAFRLMTPETIRRLALERLHADPPSPTSSEGSAPPPG